MCLDKTDSITKIPKRKYGYVVARKIAEKQVYEPLYEPLFEHDGETGHIYYRIKRWYKARNDFNGFHIFSNIESAKKYANTLTWMSSCSKVVLLVKFEGVINSGYVDINTYPFSRRVYVTKYRCIVREIN